MSNRVDFGEKSTAFFSGLNQDQLDGREEFEVRDQLVGLRITQKSRFDARASRVLEANDNALSVSDTEPMSDVTREEINAKLEAIESRMDARVSAIDGKIDAFLAAQAEREKRMDERHTDTRKALDKLDTKLESISTDLHSVRRWQSAYTAGVAIVTFLIGIGVTLAVRLLSLPAPPTH